MRWYSWTTLHSGSMGCLISDNPFFLAGVDKASALDKRADGIMIEMRKQDQWDPFLDP